MLVEVGWDGKGMCGQWSQKQGNAYKNTEEESGSGWEEERGEEVRAAERLAGVVSFNNQWQGRQGRQGVRMDAGRGRAWATSTDI